MFPTKHRLDAYKRCLILMLSLLLCLAPLAAFAEESFGVVKGGMLNLRATPSLEGEWLGSYPSGTWVQVLSVGKEWHKVKVDGKVGYMSASYVSFDQVTTITDATVSGADGFINLRESPNLSSGVLAKFNNGTRVKILSHANGWYHVKVGDLTGYMVDYLVRLDSAVSHTYAVVRTNNGGNLNLRETPGYDGKVITSFKSGQQVKVLVKGTAWHQVQADNLVGYMAAQYLDINGKPGPAPVTSKAGVVGNMTSTQVLNLRQSASLDAKVLAYYGNGTRVEILGKSGEWYKVKVDGQTGYMMAKYIIAESGSAKPSAPFTAFLKNPNGGKIVNFRAQPGLNTQVIASYAVGKQVTVLEMGENWSLVKIDQMTGYVSTYFLRF